MIIVWRIRGEVIAIVPICTLINTYRSDVQQLGYIDQRQRVILKS